MKNHNIENIVWPQVGYGDDIFVNRGDELTPTEVREQPLTLKWSSDPTLFYTLLMIGSYNIKTSAFENCALNILFYLQIQIHLVEMHQKHGHGSIGSLETFRETISIVEKCWPNVSWLDLRDSGALTLIPPNISDVGAVPARGTGLHRYVFLMFEQNGGRREFKESPITTE